MDKETFDRMLEEFRELNEKVTKIREFVTNEEKFSTVDMLNKDLLIAQLKAMETYLSVLSIRLGINGSPEIANVPEDNLASEDVNEEPSEQE